MNVTIIIAMSMITVCFVSVFLYVAYATYKMERTFREAAEVRAEAIEKLIEEEYKNE